MMMHSTAPADGHWGRWSSWGACSTTCDVGTRVRTRKCDDPIPANSGKPCPGDDEQQAACIGRRCSLGRYNLPHVLLEELKIDGRDVQSPLLPDFTGKPLNNSMREI